MPTTVRLLACLGEDTDDSEADTDLEEELLPQTSFVEDGGVDVALLLLLVCSTLSPNNFDASKL